MPTVELSSTALRVVFSEAPRASTAPFECVVDMSRLGSLVGVEILDFRRQLDGATLAPRRVTDDFRWSYDPEIDALYLHLQSGPAQIQQTSTGIAYIDASSLVAALEVVVRVVPEQAL
jgi:hypothetical protein